MTPLTTKAAEIRAGLVAGLRANSDAHLQGVPLARRVTMQQLSEAAALIEQQAAELAEARAEIKRLKADVGFAVGTANEYSQAADDWRRRATTAESERDELLREKERLGADVLTFPPGWAGKARELYDRCKLWPEKTPDGIMTLIELRNHVFAAISAPSALESGPAGLADANSKSPAPSSQSERIEVLEAALAGEREACAQAAERDHQSFDYEKAFVECRDYDCGYANGRQDAAAAIRARSALAPLGEE